jgi:hypothetical protein
MAITHTTAAVGGDSAGLIGQTQWNEAHTGIAGDGGFSFKYAFDTATSGTPSTGTLQMNNASPQSTILLYIYETDATGTVLDPILDLVNPTDFVMISNQDRSKYHVFQVTLPFVSGASIDSLPVTWLAGTGNAGSTTQFSAAETVFLSILHADSDDVIGSQILIQKAKYYMYAS